MARAILLFLAFAFAAAPAHGRTLGARIARVTTAVATLEGVEVRLDWPPGAVHGELRLRASRVDAPDLGYHFRDVSWQCPLSRAGDDAWRCEGVLRAGKGGPMRLGIDLATASTDARLARGRAVLGVHRSAATPDLTTLDLTRVPLAWTQALASRAWAEGRFTAGTVDGRFVVASPAGGPLRVDGQLALADAALDTADARIAAAHLGSRFRVAYRRDGATTSMDVQGELRGGELLYGNTYVALPSTPVGIHVAGTRRDGAGWVLPTLRWSDGGSLVATGSARFNVDGGLRDARIDARSLDLAAMPARYLSGWLGLAGLAGLEMQGGLDGVLRVDGGEVAGFDATLHDVTLQAPGDRFRFSGLDGDIRFAAQGGVESTIHWRSGAVGDVAFGAGMLPLRSGDGALRLQRDARIPLLDGTLTVQGLVLRPPAGTQGLQVQGGLVLEGLQLAALSKAMGGPAFRGTLSGRIPMARYQDNRLEFDGGLAIQVFDGLVQVTSLSMERPFGVAPTVSADLDLEGLDLLALTEVFDFGSITGHLDGRIHGLRLVDWSATAFDAELHTVRRAKVRQRISQRAVQNISSVGDSSFVSSLQGRLIGLFDDFGYRRIGISCRLVNSVCTMGGLHSAGAGFTIVEGSGIPRLDVVGFNRQVDWPVLVERLAAVGKGEVKPVFE